MELTRIRGSATALAVGLLVAGCGLGGPVAGTGRAGPAGPAGATAQADGGNAARQGEPGGGGRWCEAVKAYTDALDPLFAEGAGDHQAAVDRAHARVRDLQAAAPAEITAQVAVLGEFWDAVIDTTGKSMAEDPAAYGRLGPTMAKIETAMPPVSEYTTTHCPGLDKALEQLSGS